MNLHAWNYRVVRRTYGDEAVYAIHEIYYDEDGVPVLCSEEPDRPQGNSLEDLRADFDNYRKALDAPVLDYDNLFLRRL